MLVLCDIIFIVAHPGNLNKENTGRCCGQCKKPIAKCNWSRRPGCKSRSVASLIRKWEDHGKLLRSCPPAGDERWTEGLTLVAEVVKRRVRALTKSHWHLCRGCVERMEMVCCTPLGLGGPGACAVACPWPVKPLVENLAKSPMPWPNWAPGPTAGVACVKNPLVVVG